MTPTINTATVTTPDPESVIRRGSIFVTKEGEPHMVVANYCANQAELPLSLVSLIDGSRRVSCADLFGVHMHAQRYGYKVLPPGATVVLTTG